MKNIIKVLKSIENKEYSYEDGDEFQIELMPGLSSEEIDDLEKILPSNKIPDDIRELLLFSSGFEFEPLEEIIFDSFEEFGFEEFFPNSIQLAGDGYGNFWILDIESDGSWGNVFYVCHDPAVIVKHSDNLLQFIKHIDEYGENMEDSHLNKIHEEISYNIWRKNNDFIDLNSAKESNDEVLKNFALSLPENFIIADLRNKPNTSGFAWGKFGPKIENTIRHKTELLWGLKKK